MTSLYKTGSKSSEIITPFNITIGTIGKIANTIDYSSDLNTIRTNEIVLLSELLNIHEKSIIMLNQVPGDSILEFNSTVGSRAFPDGDGMITKTNGICLVIRTADCVPVFAFDAEKKVLGAVHAGWRGCSLNIAQKLIKKMKSDNNSKNSDLHIYILPSIGPESYSVNMDVGYFFKNDIIIKNNVIYLNLWSNIAASLLYEGIPESHIHLSEICTFINNTEYFSYRRGDTGRNLNFAFINPI
ncbi:MAG: polyphenol oxidase family protein [Spirochaetota bacterium]